MTSPLCALCRRHVPTAMQTRVTELACLLGAVLLILAGLYAGRIVERYATIEARLVQQSALLDGWSRVLIHDKLRAGTPPAKPRRAQGQGE